MSMVAKPIHQRNSASVVSSAEMVGREVKRTFPLEGRAEAKSVAASIGWLILLFMMVAMLGALGCWQWGRGLEKQRMQAAYAGATQRAPQNLHENQIIPSVGQVLAVRAVGSYDTQHTVLWAHQFQGDQRGYDVWTLMHLAEGGAIYVDRGWIPAVQFERIPGAAPQVDFRALRAPEGLQQIRGLLRALPRPAWRLADSGCRPAAEVAVWVYPSLANLSCGLNAPPMAAVLLLAPENADGWLKAWQAPVDMPPERHFGYALQWFALALTLLLLGGWRWGRAGFARAESTAGLDHT